MATKQQIILEHLNGTSNREIARILHVSKDTVNKYVNEYDHKRAELIAADPEADISEIIQDFVSEPKYKKRIRLKKAETLRAMEIIEKCLADNEEKRRTGRAKQQMKKIDIYEYLIELGFVISYSTVKRLTREIETRHEEAYIRQEYKPGDVCEFDWGIVKLDIGNEGFRNYQMAVFAPANNNNRYSRLYMSQDTMAFQESHADYFEYCGGVYRTMVYDNMKVAVKKFVGTKEKEPTQALLQLSIYYGFGFRFCNTARGNEKGHVERSVEYVRRKVFSQPGRDRFASLEEANRYLMAECSKLNEREIYDGTVPARAFEEEKKVLLPVAARFESCERTPAHVDKYSTVVVRGNHYSVPDTFVGKTVNLKIFTDKILIYHNETIIARHSRSYKKNDWRIDIYHYLRTLKRKPGALSQSAALLQSDAKVKKIYEDYYSNDSKGFLDLLEIIYEKGVDKVYDALKTLEGITPGDMSADKIRTLCDKGNEEAAIPLAITGRDKLSDKSKQTLGQYDALARLQRDKQRRAV